MIDPNDPNYKGPRDYRPIGIGLCALAALLMIYACVSSRWIEVTSDGDRLGFSLTKFEVCAKDECKSESIGKVMDEWKDQRGIKTSGAFQPMGIATLILLAISALALIATAVLAARKMKVKTPPSSFALLAIMGALVTGAIFVATKPAQKTEGFERVIFAFGVGPGFWAFGIACVLGIVGAQMLNKLLRPIDPDLAAFPPSSSMH